MSDSEVAKGLIRAARSAGALAALRLASVDDDLAVAIAAKVANDGEEPFLTVKAYAAYKGVSERTVRRWIREGFIECERAGAKGHWRIPV